MDRRSVYRGPMNSATERGQIAWSPSTHRHADIHRATVGRLASVTNRKLAGVVVTIYVAAMADRSRLRLLVTTGTEITMPATKKPSAPLTFDLPESLIAKIARARKSRALRSASELVRLALTEFDFEKFHPATDRHRQISVRIAADMRTALKRVARTNDASIGEIIRAALEALPEKSGRLKKTR